MPPHAWLQPIHRQLLAFTAFRLSAGLHRRNASSTIKSPSPPRSPHQTNLNALLLKMPRNKTHIADAQKQRLRIKEKGARYVPGTVNLQILGSGAAGSPACVYLFTDQSRYLFNCGEGTQRLAHEHKTKLARLEHIFVTRTGWQHIGGLPGLSLTVQDSGVPSLALHGPPGLGALFRSMQRFVVLKELTVEARECADGGRFEDAVLSVEYVPLLKKENPRQGCATDPTTIKQPLSNNNVIAFVCQLKPRPGALCLEKCVDRGVPTGPLLGQLKNGQDVRLADGTLVRAAEVRSPDDPGPRFCVIDVPGAEYLDSLEACAERFVSGGTEPVLLLHFSPPEVVEHPVYQRFMARFSRGTTQLMLNATNRFSGYLAAHRIQCQLNQISEHIFPMLHESEPSVEANTGGPSHKRPKLDDDIPPSKSITDDCLIENVSSLTHFHLRPLRGLDRSVEPQFCPEEYRAETQTCEGFAESLATLRADMQETWSAADVARRAEEYPRIVFLGTGSCIPNKTRNVSSILVHTSPDACILLDCGEGTAAQMRRFYGERQYREVLGKLRAIYVSHLHADHHIGLIGVLQERRAVVGATAAPVLLLAPQQIAEWLYFYDRNIEPLEPEYELLSNGALLDGDSKARTSAMGIASIRTCLVHHCQHSFGVCIEIPGATEPFKLTYSGDTMPCDALVKLGRDSTVLIHEATMEDELAEQARYKFHSTVSQAIEQGVRMRARYTLLTHFSQRYAKLPRLEQQLAKNVFVAFDNMEVRPSDMQHMGRLLPTLQLMFTDHCEEMEAKALKRAYRAERAAVESVVPT